VPNLAPEAEPSPCNGPSPPKVVNGSPKRANPDGNRFFASKHRADEVAQKQCWILRESGV